MSGNEKEDLEFEAFLKGEGELAQHLRALAQAEPSAQQDAAILAAVQTDLAREAAAPKAANDSLGPSFTTRWGLPLAAAASCVFALYIVMRHDAPPSPAKIMADAGPAARAPASKDKVFAKPAPQSTVATEASRQDRAALGESSTTPQASPEKSEAKSDEAAKEAAYMARREEADTRDQWQAAPAVLAKGQAQPKVDNAEAAPAAAAAAPAPRANASVDAAEPKVWLDRIEALLKAGATENAAKEWTEFRKRHPDYAVAPELEARLKALKK